jgi:hypothetical protein
MRKGWMVLLAAALMVGCQTPEQKAQAKLDKQQAAETKAAQKQAQADAKAQAKADKKLAEERAKAMKQETPDPVELKAMETADYYPDDRLKVIGYPDILPENYPTWLDKHAEAMVAAGASEDAMLRDGDFAGNELSADGRSRLRLMMKNPPPTIYVAAAPSNDAQKQARLAAVQKFWGDVTSRPIAVKEGVNPDVHFSANAGLKALQRLDKQAESPGSQSISGMNDVSSQGPSGIPTPISP